MRVVFLDEAGYARNWRDSVSEQPYFVLSAVCFASSSLARAYSDARSKVDRLGLLREGEVLGKGSEIKASQITRGSGWWGHHQDERNAVREVMLGLPSGHGGSAILVVIDKAAHIQKHGGDAYDPYRWAMQLVLERVQWLLLKEDDDAICILDQNKALDDVLHALVGDLVREGSTITYPSTYYREIVSRTFEIDRIIEFALGNSLNSVGLQVADFFASMTYAYYKAGKPEACDWWNTLWSSLRSVEGKVRGVGLKEFP